MEDQLKDHIQLEHATIGRIAPDVTQVLFHADVKLTNAIVADVMKACCQAGKVPAKALVVFPEHTDFNAQVMMEDQCIANNIAGEDRALAIVCLDFGLRSMLNLYLAYYPPKFEVQFCDTVEAALHWLSADTKTHLAA